MMPGGYKSTHPDQERRLREVGIPDWMITQGYGYATASAGSHVPVGTKDGRKFGWCVDVSANWTPNREHFDELVRAGFCPFFRNWTNNRHWHLVDVAWIERDNGTVPTHGSLPRSQVVDFAYEDPPRNGLKGHAPLPSEWAPTKDQQDYIRNIFKTGSAPEPVPIANVVGSNGEEIECDAKIEDGSMTAQVAKVLSAEGIPYEWVGSTKTLRILASG